MTNIIIIGAGQLGSRHLQGALKCKHPLHITIFDPSSESLNVAKIRASEVTNSSSDTQLSFVSDLPVGKKYTICIIATNANVRAEVTNNLLDSNEVEHIIFEKVLFQKIGDYKDISLALIESKTKGWVNCPRRLYPLYRELRAKINTSKPINVKVSGSNWGMACNSIHFIDVFSFLCKETKIKVTSSGLDKDVVDGKRKGFYEVNGKVRIIAGSHSLELSCNISADPLLTVEITNDGNVYFIDEANGEYYFNNKKMEIPKKYISLFQSELTGNVIGEIIDSDGSSLINYAESTELHLPLISLFLDHFSEVFEKSIEVCPIT